VCSAAWRRGQATHKVFLSRCGSRQGDPLGPILFALGMMAAMRKVQAGARAASCLAAQLLGLREGRRHVRGAAVGDVT